MLNKLLLQLFYSSCGNLSSRNWISVCVCLVIHESSLQFLLSSPDEKLKLFMLGALCCKKTPSKKSEKLISSSDFESEFSCTNSRLTTRVQRNLHLLARMLVATAYLVGRDERMSQRMWSGKLTCHRHNICCSLR